MWHLATQCECEKNIYGNLVAKSRGNEFFTAAGKSSKPAILSKCGLYNLYSFCRSFIAKWIRAEICLGSLSWLQSFGLMRLANRQPSILGLRNISLAQRQIHWSGAKFAKSQGGYLDKQSQYQSWINAPQPELSFLSLWLKNELQNKLLGSIHRQILGYLILAAWPYSLSCAAATCACLVIWRNQGSKAGTILRVDPRVASHKVLKPRFQQL